jgi:toxin ParE1/3/4
MAVYLISEPAIEDLNEIAAYISADNPAAALELILKIEARFELLAEHPKSGRLRRELAPDLRSTVEGRYLIFYQEMTDGVKIIRVLHSARDLKKLFH